MLLPTVAIQKRRNSVANGLLISWEHNLKPSLVKEKWSAEQNELLFGLHRQLGSKWKEIGQQFPNRSDNTIKNQFFSLVRKSLRKACRMTGITAYLRSLDTIRPKILSEFLVSPSNGRSDSNLPFMSLNDIIYRFAFTKVPIPLQQSDFRNLLKQSLEDHLLHLQTRKYAQKRYLCQ